MDITLNELQIPDYDCGLINDYGGGNVDWWQNYVRAEIMRCNDYWREQIDRLLSEKWKKWFNERMQGLPFEEEETMKPLCFGCKHLISSIR